MSSLLGDFYAFGSYRLNARSRVLTRSDAVVTLAPKTFDLLVFLTESGGRLLSKKALMDALWPDTAVEEANLSFQISTLRRALGQEGSAWIEAVPKHGYRFTAPVEYFPSTERNELGSRQQEPAAQALSGIHPSRRPRWLKAAVIVGLTVAAAFAVWESWSNYRKPVGRIALHAFPATTYPGRETNPSFSPDGSQIAFAWDAAVDGNFDIYVKVVGENRALRLTTDHRPEYSPAWSPDGRRIAFCRDGPSGSEIVLISVIGGPERVIANLPEPGGRKRSDRPLAWYRGMGYPNSHLAWFPDGLSLACVARPQQGGPNTIFLLSVDEQGMKPLTSPPPGSWGDDSPSVSPDGHHLAFVRSFTPYSMPAYLYVQPLESQKAQGAPQRIAAKETEIAGLAWTSDSRRLAFRAKGSLWTIGLDQKMPESLALPGFNPHFPAISRKGDRLAFVDTSQDLDIWRINGPTSKEGSGAASSAGTRLISSTRMDTNPQYSPDSTRIAFTSSRSGTTQIWVCDRDGSNLVQLTYLRSAEAGTPRWSPDGQYIAFDSLQAGIKNIGDVYVIAAQGGALRLVTPGNSNEDMPSWSHDGKWIYFESDRSGVFEIWKAPATGGTAVQVTNNGAASALESYDGRYLYYTKWQHRGLWRSPVGGGTETLVSSSGSPYLWGLYDKGICVVEPEADAGPEIKCMDFSSGIFKTFCTLPRDHPVNHGGPSFSLSGDGRSILYVGIERQESDIIVVDNFR